MSPSLQQVDEAFDAFFDNVCAADRPPPERVGLFDAIPFPADPFHALGSDAE